MTWGAAGSHNHTLLLLYTVWPGPQTLFPFPSLAPATHRGCVVLHQQQQAGLIQGGELEAAQRAHIGPHMHQGEH